MWLFVFGFGLESPVAVVDVIVCACLGQGGRVAGRRCEPNVRSADKGETFCRACDARVKFEAVARRVLR